MHLKVLTPKQSLNKAYLKEKISRTDIELFKDQFSSLLQKINKDADEEHLKSLVGDFLKFTFYKDVAQINPIGKNDMVIHIGKLPSDPIGVILEVKSPTNTPEMLSAGKPNTKALHELILYYLRERTDNNNNEIKYLVATSIFEWFVVDANEFDKKIFRNAAVKRLYDIKKSDGKDNPWFYAELKKLLDMQADLTFEVTYFDIRQYRNIIENESQQDDKGLIALYKILSPAHLLKLPFANDSNTLQPRFYAELLHLIGLYEYKEGSKKLISRKKDGERNPGSLLENTIIQLDSHDKVARLDKPSQYGDNYADRVYNVALELVITWVNRILFLKLLEAQLINYHKDKAAYSFLNKDKIKDFDDLDKLFFRVLARRANERTADVQQLFGKVPYLNSSLFEPTELEHQALFINGLEDRIKVPVLSTTVLKDANGKTAKGEMDGLDYLFAFLNAYDFSSEGGEEIQEDNKALINASVLGLIFEKINGYKDGSFFTPGFITMYMCRETIRRAVVQKFNDANGWDCKEYDELHDKITDKKEANGIINTLKICDPAVGSGHFLVSALNEIIAIKSDLRVLTDRSCRSMHYYGVEVVNDELIITDENGDIFQYNPNNTESQRVQEMLFHEKQAIIEGCLFGVDVNPNSVKICRLRLWIELLKNAYYKTDGSTRELETLPNIDINIKTGNSLISRFALEADLSQALKKKAKIQEYKKAIANYQNAKNKEDKREIERFIADIKNEFRAIISSKEILELRKLESEYYTEYERNRLFEVELDKTNKQKIEERRKTALEKLNQYRRKIEEIKSNKVYDNAFEWRFEFPEVLNDDGDFIGFDVIIGNPPYVQQRKLDGFLYLLKNAYQVYSGTADLSVFFFELGMCLLKGDGILNLISTNKFFNTEYGSPLRRYLESYNINEIINFEQVPIFDEALVSSSILTISKLKPSLYINYVSFKKELLDYKMFESNIVLRKQIVSVEQFYNKSWLFNSESTSNVLDKICKSGRAINSIDTIDIRMGIKSGYDEAFWISEETKNAFLLAHPNLKNFIKPMLRGKDIKRFTIDFKNIWLLYLPWHFPMNEQSIKGASIEAEKALKNDYPLLYEHLLIYKSQLENRSKAETGITYEWYALQRSGATFYSNFLQEKIVWGLISGHWNFAYDNSSHFITSASYMLVSHVIPIKYILAILNSKVTQYYFNHVGEKTAGGAYVLKKASIEKIVLPDTSRDYINEMVKLVDIAVVSPSKEHPNIYAEIDRLVYKLYDLTDDEIEVVEGAI